MGRVVRRERPRAGLHEPLVLPSLFASGSALKPSHSLPCIGNAGPRPPPVNLEKLSIILPEVSCNGQTSRFLKNASAPDLRNGRSHLSGQLGKKLMLPKHEMNKMATPKGQLSVPPHSESHPNRRPSLLEVSQLAQLEEGAHESNLSGPAALAFALVAKCGSIENAWKRFDVNRSGKISRWQWESGLKVLHIDTQRLCGDSEQSLFSQLASTVSSSAWSTFRGLCSEVSSSQWSTFFKPFLEDPNTANTLKEALQHFQDHKHVDTAWKSRVAVGKTQTNKWNHELSGLADALEKESKMSAEELEEVELQAAAECSQLQEELGKLKLKGSEALAYILTAKFGSLQNAFRWLNSNGSGRLSHVEWDTGVRIMRLDLEKLTGHDIRTFFKNMTGETQIIRHKDWRVFFQAVTDNASSNFNEMLQQAAGSDQGSLAERAKSKKNALSDAKKKDLGDDHPGGGSSSKHCVGGSSSKNDNIHKGEANKIELSDDNPGGHVSKHCVGDSSSKNDNINKRQRSCDKRLAAIRDNRLDATMNALGNLSEEELNFRERIRAELSQLDEDSSAEYSIEDMPDLNERHFLIIESVALELGLYPHGFKTGDASDGDSEQVNCMIVFNLRDFPLDALEKLRAIPTHSCYEFPPSLSIVQRQCVHLLSASIGFWTKSEGRLESRRIIAFNVGDFANEVRTELKTLKPGESKIFSPELSEPQRKLVHMIASELHFTSHSEGVGDARHVEVFNLAAFAEKVRSELEKLGSGEHKAFAKTLTREERKIVHCISDELNLAHVSEGVGADRAVTIANLIDFYNVVRSELEKLQPGGSKAFEPELSVVQRKAVHEVATELGMASFSQGGGGERFVSVSRPLTSANGPRKGKRHRHDEDAGSDDEETEADDDEMERVFQQYATGSFKGDKLYTRMDLDAFCDVLLEVTLHRQTSKKKMKELSIFW